jgi:hypothetical protein
MVGVKRRTLGKTLGVAGARSAYILFVNKHREEKKRSNPEASNTELVKLLAEDWRRLSVREKEKYSKEAVKDKKRYDRELENAIKNNPDKVEEFKKLKFKKKKRNTFGVKGARSAYILFSSSIRPKIQSKYPNLKMTEITKKIGEEWRKLSDSKKTKFQNEAEKDKIRFQNEFQNAAAAAAATDATDDSTPSNDVVDNNQTTPKPKKVAKKVAKKVVKRKRK